MGWRRTGGVVWTGLKPTRPAPLGYRLMASAISVCFIRAISRWARSTGSVVAAYRGRRVPRDALVGPRRRGVPGEAPRS